jgi:hypothetical protein
MSLLDLAGRSMVGRGSRPTLLDEYRTGQKDDARFQMEQQTGLSNLATADLQRQGMQQQMEQQKSSFEVQEETRQMMRQYWEKIKNDPDPERQMEGLRMMQGYAIQANDPQLAREINSFKASFAPGSSYGEQHEEYEMGLEGEKARRGKTQAETEKLRAEAEYIRAGKPGSGGGGKPSLAAIPQAEATGLLSPVLDRFKGAEKQNAAVSGLIGGYNSVIEWAKNNGVDIDTNLLKSELYQAANSAVIANRLFPNDFDLEAFKLNVNQIVNKYRQGAGQQGASQSGVAPEDEQSNVITMAMAREDWLNQKRAGWPGTFEDYLQTITSPGYGYEVLD